MVHVKKCPLGKRGYPTTGFWKDGVPQIYCLGFVNNSTDEPLEECKQCKDFADGEQLEIDFEEEWNRRTSDETEKDVI